jgi:hypothetical protein
MHASFKQALMALIKEAYRVRDNIILVLIVGVKHTGQMYTFQSIVQVQHNGIS